MWIAGIVLWSGIGYSQGKPSHLDFGLGLWLQDRSWKSAPDLQGTTFGPALELSLGKSLRLSAHYFQGELTGEEAILKKKEAAVMVQAGSVFSLGAGVDFSQHDYGIHYHALKTEVRSYGPVITVGCRLKPGPLPFVLQISGSWMFRDLGDRTAHSEGEYLSFYPQLRVSSRRIGLFLGYRMKYHYRSTVDLVYQGVWFGFFFRQALL
jgi:hypothetical protein